MVAWERFINHFTISVVGIDLHKYENIFNIKSVEKFKNYLIVV